MQAVLPVRVPVCVWRDPIRRAATVARCEGVRRREGLPDEQRA